MSGSILILGGAGYIGAHAGYLLSKLGYRIIIVDKFVHHQRFAQRWAEVIHADFADEAVMSRIFETNNIAAVMHFAAFIEVGESVKRPKEFYDNNVQKVFTLMNVMLRYGINKFIFSSSCAVYGNPVKVPMDEQHQTVPVSPYGRNKLIVEYALQDYAQAYDFNFVSLRYFNAAGALPELGLGERHDPETHLIPLLLRAIQAQTVFKIFGSDYSTKDGTCVRDYVHVLDIAQAHVNALIYLQNGMPSDFFNLGTGHGYTVQEVVHAAELVCGKKVIVEMCGRRKGDAAVLVADPSKAEKILGWRAQHSDLYNIISSAFVFEQLKKENAKRLLCEGVL